MIQIIKFIVFIFPLAEILILIKVSARIGFFDTLALMVFSTVLGIYLLRVYSQYSIAKLQQAIAEKRSPSKEMLDGVQVFLSGILLILPGFLTDALGLILLFPITRWLVQGWLVQYMQGSSHGSFFKSGKPEPSSGNKPKDYSDVQDAEIIE